MSASNEHFLVSGGVIDHDRIQAGIVLQRLMDGEDMPFFLRDLHTKKVVEVITEQAAPALDKKFRKMLNLEHFTGVANINEEESTNG